ncbi:GNAT family N-acetyltransferase [Actinacidiphila acidipaludis]|uniref:GNAT family N-acetyltransferase n=1 Tax=Actinacidiphila acidipaludis TaxID=2873382 RepID=A0ABS7QH38_9ACTN|nr:GNAT family N-acetyltransferase [Streptomyces acidipaludis]MBY8882121.1 GNAT family N-acetyltransferase [Streptomyces acidipaludis]
MPPRVRAAAAADGDGVFRLLAGFATSHRPDRAVFDDVTFPRVLRAVADGSAEVLVAERETRVVGYVLAVRMPTLFAGGTILELLELCVEEAERGRGTGSALIRSVQAAAVGSGDVEVTVPTRRAAGFYAGLGFEETAAYLKWPVG